MLETWLRNSRYCIEGQVLLLDRSSIYNAIIPTFCNMSTFIYTFV